MLIQINSKSITRLIEWCHYITNLRLIIIYSQSVNSVESILRYRIKFCGSSSMRIIVMFFVFDDTDYSRGEGTAL